MLVFLTAGKENKMKKNIPHEILTVKNINHAVFSWGHRVSSHCTRDTYTFRWSDSFGTDSVNHFLMLALRQIPRAEN